MTVPQLSFDHAFNDVKVTVVKSNLVAGDEDVEFATNLTELFLGLASLELNEEHIFD